MEKDEREFLSNIDSPIIFKLLISFSEYETWLLDFRTFVKVYNDSGNSIIRCVLCR